MKTIQFYTETNRSGGLLHIETDGAVINLRVGLTDAAGRRVTSVEILPDDESRGGDGLGNLWHLDGHLNNRIIRQHRCAVCGGVLVPGEDDDGFYHVGGVPDDGHYAEIS